MASNNSGKDLGITGVANASDEAAMSEFQDLALRSRAESERADALRSQADAEFAEEVGSFSTMRHELEARGKYLLKEFDQWVEPIVGSDFDSAPEGAGVDGLGDCESLDDMTRKAGETVLRMQEVLSDAVPLVQEYHRLYPLLIDAWDKSVRRARRLAVASGFGVAVLVWVVLSSIFGTTHGSLIMIEVLSTGLAALTSWIFVRVSKFSGSANSPNGRAVVLSPTKPVLAAAGLSIMAPLLISIVLVVVTVIVFVAVLVGVIYLAASSGKDEG